MGSLIVIFFLVICCHTARATYVVSWGSNTYGQLGTGSYISSTTPTVVVAYGPVVVTNIRVGLSTHFAMLSDGTVYCGGNNFNGQLGLNSVLNQVTPVDNYLALGLDAYPIGPETVAYNATTKDVFGWGEYAGYVQGSAITGNQLTPLRSLNPDFTGSVVSISTAWATTFVSTNGGTYVAGSVITYTGYTADNPSKFGTNATANELNFVRMSFWDDVPLQSLFPSSASHVCGYAKNFSLFCWGRNNAGQLGVGTTTDAYIPTFVSFFDNNGLYPAQVQTGDSHTVALTCGGKVYTWGNNANGNLGLGSKDSLAHTTPSLVASLSSLGIIEIVSGMNTVWARNSTNYWYVWGASANNQTLLLGPADVVSPTLYPYFKLNNLTRIASGSKSTYAFAWQDPNPPSQINSYCPVLKNECLLGSDNCVSNSLCIDTERSYLCLCNAGYTGNGIAPKAGGTGCIDIDECAQSSTGCTAGSTCDNQMGGFLCTCPVGYQGDGKINGSGCVDINECTVGGYCPVNTVCTNTIGSYFCNCSSGFQNIGTSPCGVICTDIDECTTLHPCNNRSSCNNTIGSYSCVCLPGYSGSTCQDINECTTGGDNCELQSYCHNLPGSFQCTCPSGFAGNAISTVLSGGTGCTDINECMNASSCPANSTCANSVGSFTCTCNSGFSGPNCTDINECNTTNKCVTSNGYCINTPGSYKCNCSDGFSGNGVKTSSGGSGCTDINECTAGTDNCDPHSVCTNTAGSYNCTCLPGFLGSGSFCYTVNCSVGYYPNSSSTCAQCPAGTYSNETNIQSCSPCPAGTYSAAIGQTSAKTCKACGTNTYSTAGSSKCAPCPPGSVSTTTGTVTCPLCPAGQYEFQGTCQVCGAGFYSSVPGSLDCAPCPPGTYANSSTASSCTLCPAGSFSKGKAAVCSSCPAGSYTSSAGQYICSSCAPGSSTQGAAGASACTPCAPGSYASLPASPSCTSCGKGTYSATNGADICIGCAPGSFQNLTGQSSCQLCSDWQFTATYASLSCGNCYQGLYSATEFGSSGCLACPPGTFRDGSTPVCLPCYAGSASGLAGLAHCSYCMGGFYAQKCGATVCEACPVGSFSPYGATGQTSCSYCPLGAESFGTAFFCYS